MINLQTKPNINGNIKQLQIDTENKTIKTGSYIFISYDVAGLTRSQLDDILTAFLSAGYTKISDN